MKKQNKILFSRIFAALLLVGVSLFPLFQPENAYAAQITARRLTLQPFGANGGSQVSVETHHFFEFTVPGGNTVGSILFLYCTSAAGACTTPSGLDTDDGDVVLGSQSGITGFTLVNATNGAPYLTRTAAAVGANVASSYQLQEIINPSAENTTFYVRISTYTSTDTTGSPLDTGVVAASTTRQIVLTGTMPESLVFCTGETVTVNCGTINGGGSITFNDLFSPTITRYATSQFAASTNAGAGYQITVRGPTMTSGANTITAIGGTAAASATGTGQFGMNLRANTTPGIGTDVTPASGAATLQAQPTTNFDTPDQFAFSAGTDNIIANSDDDGTSGPTDSQVYTAAYIVNVSGSQPAGTYTTTLTYVCTPTF
jgi:hypothetical protein